MPPSAARDCPGPPLRGLPAPPQGGTTLGRLKTVWSVLVVLCAASFLAVLGSVVDDLMGGGFGDVWTDVDDFLAHIVPLALAGGAVAAPVWRRAQARGVLRVIDHVRQGQTSGDFRRAIGPGTLLPN